MPIGPSSVSRLAKWFMELLPLPIVMAMVAGVFLSFGLDLIHSLWDAPLLTIPMAIAFAVLVALPRLGAKVPPVLAVTAAGQWNAGDPSLGFLATPLLHAPEFTVRATAELVLPLAITVIVVQNGQRVAVLRGTGRHPPVTASAILSGVWSVIVAPVGAVSSCLTGPINALIVAGKPADRHWAAAIVTGAGAIVVGILAQAFVGVILRTPAEFLAALAGLAMLVPLCGAGSPCGHSSTAGTTPTDACPELADARRRHRSPSEATASRSETSSATEASMR